MKRHKYHMTAMNLVSNTVKYFRWHNQYRDSTKLIELLQYLDPEEIVLFDVDIRKLD